MYKIGSMPHSIPIGYTGETNFRQIDIDMTAWMDKMPAGVPSIVHIRPGEEKEDAYVAVTEFDRETGILSWTITAADIGTLEGEGEMQVWLEETENDTVNKRGKSVIVKTKVIEAANSPDENVPTSQEAFIEQVTSLKTQTVTAKEAAEDAQTAAEEAQAAAEQAAEDAENVNLHPAYIDETTKHWMVYDAVNHEYVDTQIKAQGEDGQDGQDGQDATPTLVCPAYADLTFPVSAGTMCYKDGTLYKAKQDISTSEEWTAAHWDATNIDTELRLQKNHIHQVGDINKAIVTLFQHTAFTDTEAATAFSTLYDLVYGSEPAYQKVAYVETDGASRIDTGVHFDGTKDIEVTLEMSFNGTTDSDESILNGWSAGGAVGVSRVGGRTNAYWSDGDLPRENDLFHVDEMTTCVMTIYAGTSAQTVSVITNTYGTSTLTRSHANVANRTYLDFPLFALSKQASFDFVKTGMRIKSAVIKIGGVVIRSMYACYRISDNVIGFYDEINDVFYANAGTGNFTKGGDIS